MEHPENSTEYAGLQVNAGVEQQSIINPYLKRGRFKSVGQRPKTTLRCRRLSPRWRNPYSR